MAVISSRILSDLPQLVSRKLFLRGFDYKAYNTDTTLRVFHPHAVQWVDDACRAGVTGYRQSESLTNHR